MDVNDSPNMCVCVCVCVCNFSLTLSQLTDVQDLCGLFQLYFLLKCEIKICMCSQRAKGDMSHRIRFIFDVCILFH